MSKTLLTVKTDVSLKQAAKETAEELGLSLGTAVNAFLRQFVRERSITISASYKPSAYLREVLALAEEDLDAGKFSKKFTSMDAMLADLKK
jgi:addiction module RelB/DinJ family antitoxin